MTNNKFKKIQLKLLFLLLISLSPIYAEDLSFYHIGGKDKYYKIQAGENLMTVAEKYFFAAEHLMWANSSTTLNVAEGRNILLPSKRIVPIKDGKKKGYIVVNIPEFMVYIFTDEGKIRFFPIATGAPKTPTPTGVTKVIEKVKNPTWIPPEWAGGGDPVEAGPDNPLGDRWVGLGFPGYGIHSTTSPNSIGLSASHGCMRMRPNDVHVFFDLVRVGMPVYLIYEPIVIGQDHSTKIIYMSVFPDNYSRIKNYYDEAMQKLAFYGISEIVDKNTIRRAVIDKKGIPIPILGSDIEIMINGKKAELGLPPIKKDNKIYVTDSFFNQIGLESDFDGEYITFLKNDKAKSFKVNQDYSLSGEYLIPLREVLESFNINTEYKDNKINIVINENTTIENQNNQNKDTEEKVMTEEEEQIEGSTSD